MPIARALLWFVSLAALFLVVFNLLFAPFESGVVWWALAAYLGFVFAGALFPRFEMYGDVFWRGSPKLPLVALTFDDGPDPVTTPRVLEMLREREAVATFFVIGAKAKQHPELVRQIVEAGHDVGVHGHQHLHGYAWLPPSAVASDIRAAQQAVQDAAGTWPRWFRPPIGILSPRTARGAERAGVVTVGWSVRALDGLRRSSADGVLRRVLRGLEPGAVLLLHDALESGLAAPPSLEILPQILEAISQRSLRPVTISELIRAADWLHEA